MDNIGLLMIYANFHEGMSDAEMFRQETELGVLAEEVGFDCAWVPEHHFDVYAESPDNLQTLSYLAGRTSRIKLGTGAVILPWNSPLRVVEKLLMLDHLSNGRAVFGMGRGLAAVEYEGFGIDMESSRARFDEAAPMIIRGLKTGIVEGDGPYYPQPRVEVRPAPDPNRPWEDRIFGVAMSPTSVPPVAENGATMMTFIQYEVSKHAESVNEWRRLYREHHGVQPPPVMTLDACYCHQDPEEAERVARKYMTRHFTSIIQHYDMAGNHWRSTKGYENYQQDAEIIQAAGMEAAAAGYPDTQVFGTPEQIIELYRERMDVLGEYSPTIQPSFGGMPFPMVRESVRLFADKVIPELRKMTTKTVIGV
ncbi:LLM class flavin-dependent oxidoreductase [Rhodococcus sp. NPDC019627]|uniref:LLM class flavin-dependent oxidoreductase n=1 Tax=unclassified Rhodococcus (in: high G+C Gram-positive bacteria) TaxID=192944 RepID=UPI0033EBEE35